MRNINYLKKIFQICLILSVCVTLLPSCSSNKSSEIQKSDTIKPSQNNLSPTQNAVVTPVFTATNEVIFTPTPDTRIPPDKWKSWPIIPLATNRAIEINKMGQVKGVNPNAFSKIGDCQNVKESFMGIYDTDRYFLLDSQSGWQETIDQFKGFFNRDSFAFGQGLNVAAALSPLHADPVNCQPNENPVQCELRQINPAYAIIRFERWYPDITPPETYEKYLRHILDTVIEHGTVPILMTKADNVEGNHQINAIISKLAYEYDVPLYNWWLAAQALPNHGLDPDRDDQFHIDPKYAWIEQSAYGLGALDSIWRGTKGQ